MRDGTGSVELRWLVEDVDRHGNVRVYLRRPGSSKIRLRQPPGSAAFLAEYRAAVEAAGRAAASPPRPRPGDAAQGSLQWLCERYYVSAEFQQLDRESARVRRRILEALCIAHGEKPYARLEARHVREMLDRKAATPGAAINLLKALRRLFAFAVDRDLAPDNPAARVPYPRTGGTGFHTWTIEEVEAFERRHPIGSRARLALGLLLYTAQRRSDVVRLGPQHVRDGWLTFTQTKNARRAPVTISLPVVAPLQALLAATPSGHMTFLVTELGKPFTPAGFGNWFRERCNEAGLPHCSAHGLRKAALTLLAERGASEREIMAVSGHRTSKEVDRYTRAARQKVLAEAAFAHLGESQKSGTTVPLFETARGGGTKRTPK